MKFKTFIEKKKKKTLELRVKLEFSVFRAVNCKVASSMKFLESLFYLNFLYV